MMVFNLKSSNNKLLYIRKYTNLIAVASNIGGVASVIFITFVILYSWYNHLKMKQNLLNFGILNKDDSKLNPKEITDWEKNRYFSFWEIFSFSYLGNCLRCLGKDKKKLVSLRKNQNILVERLDIINMMQVQRDLGTVKNALFKPY